MASVFGSGAGALSGMSDADLARVRKTVVDSFVSRSRAMDVFAASRASAEQERARQEREKHRAMALKNEFAAKRQRVAVLAEQVKLLQDAQAMT